jgi:hypothetical protein
MQAQAADALDSLFGRNLAVNPVAMRETPRSALVPSCPRSSGDRASVS